MLALIYHQSRKKCEWISKFMNIWMTQSHFEKVAILKSSAKNSGMFVLAHWRAHECMSKNKNKKQQQQQKGILIDVSTHKQSLKKQIKVSKT